jgi:hypothetical protein
MICGCAGDLSVGDPGYNSSIPAGEDGGTADWWSTEHELLSAPKRNAGLGINYKRSAKQVRCITLCLPRLHALGIRYWALGISYQPQPLSKAGALRWFADALCVWLHDGCALTPVWH